MRNDKYQYDEWVYGVFGIGLEDNMALPQTEHPLIDVHVHTLNKSVKFRPFLVKEEKLLILANETKDMEEMMKATQQIITNCSFGKVHGDELPVFDMQNIFLNLRKVSVSETIEAILRCGHCEHKIDIIVDLNNFELYETEGHEKTVRLSENVSVEMRYPNAKEMTMLGKSETEGDVFKVAQLCMKTIFSGDSIVDADELKEEDKTEFIDNLTSQQFKAFKQFFESMPVMENEIKYKCPKCEKSNITYLNGYYDFFV